jgi:DNA-binding MarR family transcriptional regulator
MLEETPHLGFVAALSLLGGAADAHVLAELRRRGLPGLTVGHGYVVQRLLAGPATASEVAAALGVTQQATSKTVQDLRRLGYVHQVADPTDRRRRPVELTATGRRAVAVAREVRAELEGRIAEIVGPERFATGEEVLAAAMQVLGMADDVRRRSVPPPPESS